MTEKIFILLVCVVGVGCSDRRPDLGSAKTEAASARFAALYGEEQPGSATSVERKLIKTGNLSMRVDDVHESKKKISGIVSAYTGYSSEERLDNYGDRLTFSMVIRVPADQYDTLVYAIEQLGEKVESKSVNVQDVTEEFIDTEARLRTKKELESRYREILKEARTVTDILAVESQLNTVRGEIESMEGRLKYLTSQVSFSTLNLNFYQQVNSDFGFGGQVTEGFRNGWTNLLSFLVGLINIWPFLLLTSGCAWGLLRWRKNRKAI